MQSNTFINKHSGFFLIELLVALGIFSLTCLLIAQFHSTIIIGQQESEKYYSALNLASSIIDEVITFGIQKNNFKIGEFDILIEGQPPSKNMKSGVKLAKEFNLMTISVIWITMTGKQRRIAVDFGLIS